MHDDGYTCHYPATQQGFDSILNMNEQLEFSDLTGTPETVTIYGVCDSGAEIWFTTTTLNYLIATESSRYITPITKPDSQPEAYTLTATTSTHSNFVFSSHFNLQDHLGVFMKPGIDTDTS